MVKIDVANDQVTINVLGLHKLWTLKSRINLARKNIKSVKIVDRSVKAPLWRIPGVYVPWLITAGTYRGTGRKEFWDTTLSDKRVSIDLANESYTRIVVEVEDPEETLKEIQNPAQQKV